MMWLLALGMWGTVSRKREQTRAVCHEFWCDELIAQQQFLEFFVAASGWMQVASTLP